MFEEFSGIPLHPLVVHAVVVFVPLQILAALAYTFWPAVRSKIAWFVVGTLVIAPGSALIAKLSGDALRARLTNRHEVTPAYIPKFDQHMGYGTNTLYLSAGLSVLMILLLVFNRGASTSFLISPNGNTVLGAILAVVTLGVAVATGYYVFRTGDTGAHMVWQNL